MRQFSKQILRSIFASKLAFTAVVGGTLLMQATSLHAQVPQKFNYQGIARDAKGNPLANQKLGLKISVLPTQDASQAEYEETHFVTTNEFGLYTLQIGNGTAVAGTFKTVKWETGNKYISVGIDPNGGSNYVNAGTSQLLSVPYAIYSDMAGTAGNTANTTRATNNYIEKTNGSGVANSTSQLYDNGTNIGYGTTSPAAKVHISNTVAAVQEHLRMQNLSATGAGRFTMYNDGASSYATFTKYGTTYAGGYAGVAALYPYANLLAFGNNGLAAGDGNGRFLISTAGNAGISLFKSGSSKLKFHADFTTENVGIGGNSTPVARIHANNTDGTTMDLRLTNNTTGHTATDGLEVKNVGTLASIINKENDALVFGTSNIENMRINADGILLSGSPSNLSNSWYRANFYQPSIGEGSAIYLQTLDAGNTASDGGQISLSSGTNPYISILNRETGGIMFGTYTTSGSMFISDLGNVGIGTVSPSTRLHVKSSSYLNSTFENNGISADKSTLLSLKNANASASTWYMGTGGTGNGMGLQNGEFYVEDNGLGVRMMIDKLGNTHLGGGQTLANTWYKLGIYQPNTGAGSAMYLQTVDAGNTALDGAQISLEAGSNPALGILNRETGGISFKTSIGSTKMQILDNGNVGIGTTTPSAKLDVVGSVKITDGTEASGKVLTSDASGNATWTNPSISSSIGTNNYIPKFATSGTSLVNSSIQDNGTSISIGSTTPSLAYQVYTYRQQLTVNGDGQSTLHGYRTRDSQNDGTGYAQNTVNSATSGYNFWGDVYTFGLAGHSYNDYSRTGGVLGAQVDGNYWGALGYRSSGLLNYGVYGSSAYASGTGYLPSNEVAGIGGGFFGSMIGSVSKGKVIGQMNSGELLASYNLGDEYTSGHQIELVNNGTERVPAYSVTSTELTIYKKGKITLQNGSAYVAFDNNYTSLLADIPVVTVTAMGACNGLYIEQIDRKGFTVRELNNGTSNVSVSWISVADRIDQTSAQAVPSEMLQNSFDENLQLSLHDDSNKEQSGQGMWWDGQSKKVRFGQVPASTSPAPKSEQ